MLVTGDISEIGYNADTVLTVGSFDGVHLGHRQIIEKLNAVKQSRGYRTIVVTFDPHPRIVLKNRPEEIKLLTSTSEKLYIFKKLGIDAVWLINFTYEFSRTTAESFYEDLLLKQIGFKELVMGYDHMFGKDRQGGFDTLKELADKHGFKLDKIEEYTSPEGEHISSTDIRNHLASGDVHKANRLLGYRYKFAGNVIHGDARGRKIGYPTANVKLNDEHKLIPKPGIYAAIAEISGERFGAMLYVGYNETFTNEKELRVEANLLNFEGDIYGSEISLELVNYIRGDIRFNSAEELVQQINNDKHQITEILKKETFNN